MLIYGMKYDVVAIICKGTKQLQRHCFPGCGRLTKVGCSCVQFSFVDWSMVSFLDVNGRHFRASKIHSHDPTDQGDERQ